MSLLLLNIGIMCYMHCSTCDIQWYFDIMLCSCCWQVGSLDKKAEAIACASRRSAATTYPTQVLTQLPADGFLML